MGLFGTRWEATCEGHLIAVVRDELTKGFAITWDGVEIARRSWSWIGLGELHGTAEVKGQPKEVRVALEWGGLSALKGRCTITVDGQNIPAVQVR